MVPRVVLDTSVLLAQLGSGLRVGTLWALLAEGRVIPVVSRETYEELRDKLGDPRFGLTDGDRNSILSE